MKFTEAMLNTYAQPLSDSEESMCRNSIRMVADALKELGLSDDGTISTMYPETYAYSLNMRSESGKKVKIFVQGSYANNTNVRTQSDVDIAVIQEDVFITEYRSLYNSYPQSDEDYGFTSVPPSAKSFKDEVQECLERKFGSDVERKNKSIKIHGNTYRKDADSVPCRRYRDYRGDYRKNPDNYVGGIVIMPDHGSKIINFPEQHIENGREKNISTHQYYKKMVRIMKKMRYLMEEDTLSLNRIAAKNISSFMLESLLWNIDDQWYLENCEKYRKVFAFHLLIRHLEATKSYFKNYKEANGIKALCGDDTAYANLCTFIDQLKSYYEYE